LPRLLEFYVGENLLADRVDLERVVLVGAPVILAGLLCDVLSDRVATQILPAYTRSHIVRALRMFSARLDPTVTLIEAEDQSIYPDRAIVADLALRLEDTVADFAGTVLIGGPATPPTTPAQRKAARRRRLENYQHVEKLKGLTATFSSVCRKALVDRQGHGSGADWLRGRLKDDTKTARAIESVIDFRNKA
jgi:hypothetical protein